MQRASNTWRVTTFGAGSLGPQSTASNRFARGTIPRMKGTTQGELGNPVVWFKTEKTKGLSEKVTEAFHQQSGLPRRRANSVITGLPSEKLGRGVCTAEDIQEVLCENTDDTTIADVDEESMPLAVEPDAIFTTGTAPIHFGRSEQVAGPRQRSSRNRLANVDLWTIVVGTLVLSIGAQYLLQGFGLSNL